MYQGQTSPNMIFKVQFTTLSKIKKLYAMNLSSIDYLWSPFCHCHIFIECCCQRLNRSGPPRYLSAGVEISLEWRWQFTLACLVVAVCTFYIINIFARFCVCLCKCPPLEVVPPSGEVRLLNSIVHETTGRRYAYLEKEKWSTHFGLANSWYSKLVSLRNGPTSVVQV